MSRVVALAGRPNTGKTTLFNSLTGLRQRVANFAGCTVEKAVGTAVIGAQTLEIVDLPGTFSILAASEDEAVAFRFLSQSRDRDLVVLCVAEASNLGNDLALAAALQDCGYPAAVVVNMIDEAEHNGIAVDAGKLEKELGMPVFLASAREGRGLEEIEAFLEARPPSESGAARDLTRAPREELASVQNAAHERAEKAVQSAVRLPGHRLLPTVARSIRIDRVLFHPIVGPLILAATLLAVFESLFAAGGPAGDLLSKLFAQGAALLRPLIAWPLLASLVCDGIIAGVAAVLVFLPQIAILFALIGLLEQSGYLPRAGAMVDRALRPFGLDGKVFIPFLSSFACAIPGVMAARTISNEKRRLTAIFLSPLMTCSARIPVYTLIIAAFVPESWRILGLHAQTAVMAGLYLLGIVAALALALVIKKTPLYDPFPSPVTVLPPYRLPKAKELARYMWVRCSHFIFRAGKVIFMVAVLLWALSNFPRYVPPPAVAADPSRAAAAQIEHSALGMVGKSVAPVFAPLGFDWRLSVGVLSSVAAREVFVGTLGSLFALSGANADHPEGLVQALRDAKTPSGAPLYGLPTAVSLLLFFALAMQCMSTIAIVRRETGGWKWPIIQFCCYFVLAYAAAWSGYHLTAWLV